MIQSRRHFLATSSAVLAGLAIGARTPLHALTPRECAQAPTAFFPDRADDATLQGLAQQAIDAARRAGATYADIRIGETHQLVVEASLQTIDPAASIRVTRGYGMRALVNGVWGFVSGVTLTPERIVQSAREAVAHARNIAARSGAGMIPIELAATGIVPAPRGTYATPVVIDPFTVPLDVQAEQLGACCAAIDRVLWAGGYARNTWLNETRVFASSEGALLTQRLMRGNPEVSVGLSLPSDRGGGGGPLPHYGWASGGFEVTQQPDLMDRIKMHADESVRFGTLPEMEVDVGRYAVVMEGPATAGHVMALAQACELDRASGLEADAAGSSFLVPIEDVLAAKTTQFSSQVTLSVAATETAHTSVRWDDEGTRTAPGPLIAQGRVVNYIATRETAPILMGSTRSPVSFFGGCCAEDMKRTPVTAIRELAMAPGSRTLSVDTLVRDLTNGLLLRRGNASLDASLSTGSSGGQIFVVKGGQVVGRVKEIGFLHRTTKLWKDSLVAIGDASTLHRVRAGGRKGMPWQDYSQTVTAPAALFKDVDVISYKARRAATVA